MEGLPILGRHFRKAWNQAHIMQERMLEESGNENFSKKLRKILVVKKKCLSLQSQNGKTVKAAS